MKNILFTLIVFLFVLGCTKQEANTFYLSDEVKRNFSFKPGSYWIYRDSISGREDSCYVSNAQTSIIDDGLKDPDPFSEALSIALIQIPKDQNINEKLNWGLLFKKEKIQTNFNIEKKGKEIARAVMFECTYPIPQNPKNLVWANPQGAILSHFPSLNINSNIFSNVDMFSTESSNYLSYYFKDSTGKTRSTIYFNDSIGFIKMAIAYKDVIKNDITMKYDDTIVINQVWELIRYKIIK